MCAAFTGVHFFFLSLRPCFINKLLFRFSFPIKRTEQRLNSKPIGHADNLQHVDMVATFRSISFSPLISY